MTQKYEKLIKDLSGLSLKHEYPCVGCFSTRYDTDENDNAIVDGLSAEILTNGQGLEIEFLNKIYEVCKQHDFECLVSKGKDIDTDFELWFYVIEKKIPENHTSEKTNAKKNPRVESIAVHRL